MGDGYSRGPDFVGTSPRQLYVGDRVEKCTGYAFPGVVVARFTTLAGELRFVVECTATDVSGCLHIFNAYQLRKVSDQ